MVTPNSGSHPIGAGNYMDVIGNVRISEVWAALGGGPLLPGKRGRAFWRNGDGFNVSLDDAKGAFFDHARGDGGGILKLIQLVRGGSPSQAMEWLCGFAGVEFAPARRDKPAPRREDLAEANEVTAWWRARTQHLKCKLAINCNLYHRTRNWLISHEGQIQGPATWQVEPTSGEVAAGEVDPSIDAAVPAPELVPSLKGTRRWEFMMQLQNDAWADFQRYEAELDAAKKLSVQEIVDMFREQRDHPEKRDFYYFTDGLQFSRSKAGEEFLAWWDELEARQRRQRGGSRRRRQ